MRVPSEHPLAKTHSLLDASLAAKAVTAMTGTTDEVEVTGLSELLLDPPSADAAKNAFLALANAIWPETVYSVAVALQSRWRSVRAAAVRFIDDHSVLSLSEFEAWRTDLIELLDHRLRTDTSWSVRRDAFLVLADAQFPLDRLLVATHDPHWRVRHAFIEFAKASDVDLSVASASGKSARTRGVLAYLSYLRNGVFDFEAPAEPPSRLHDSDPAVMDRELRRLDKEEVQTWLPEFPDLLWHSDDRIRKLAAKHLLEFGNTKLLARAAGLLDDPREFGWQDTVDLFAALSPARAEAVAAVRREHGIKASDEGVLTTYDLLERLKQRLPVDRCSIGRRESLDEERARELMDNPTLEKSWLVLRAACRIAKKPQWEITPTEPYLFEDETEGTQLAYHAANPPANTFSIVPRIPFGDLKLPVSRMGLSGHYRLPEAGFANAMDAGINLTFWEPNYDTMTRFFRSLPPAQRAELHVIAGSFAADARGIRADAERALRNLRVDCLTLFMCFWVRSWKRISDEVRDVLEALREEGKIRMFGLSTHNRQLAVNAIEENWNPVMVRHSIAHRGAEQTVFPVAKKRGTSLITFNNTCYGRLLVPYRGSTPPTAAECYRYTLSQDAVSCCLTAPSTIEQLRHNLTAFHAEWDTERSELLSHGEIAYEQDRCFRMAVRAVR